MVLADKTDIGFLAHVDAGKTSLIESLLYVSGMRRTFGRVDHRDSFLDTERLERERGITIWAKLAELSYSGRNYTLIDTPGHVDFALEAERSLSLLDYAVLVVAEGKIPGHTRLLYRILKKHRIPVLIFINKMDMADAVRETAFDAVKESLADDAVDFTALDDSVYEEIADKREDLIEKFLSGDSITTDDIKSLWKECLITPVLFGSALKNEGITELLEFLNTYTERKEYPEEFGLEAAKLLYEKGNVLTLAKVTGGELKVKSFLGEDKVDQIRICSGPSFTLTKTAKAGDVVVLQGLDHVSAGDAFGCGKKHRDELSPVLEYSLVLPEKADPVKLYSEFKSLCREMPELRMHYEEETAEIRCSVMGRVQMEILESIIKERFKVEVGFSEGSIVYKETVRKAVEGVGHYEPLRHYAEVHIVIEPLPRGTGIETASMIHTNDLALNWQRLINQHLLEKTHRGVLTGSALTDVRFIIVNGRAHLKHTEGGDFRESTYRAIRQGLMKAENVLLEPIYSFELEVPETSMGRAMSDIERMHGSFEPPVTMNGSCLIKGRCPVSTIRDYQTDVTGYTHGNGSLSLFFAGYEECHDTEEVVERIGYDAESDRENPAGSVFCAHGAGFYVPWQAVESFMHLGMRLST